MTDLKPKRTPEQIIGHDAYMQLVFEGYTVTRPTPTAPALETVSPKDYDFYENGELVTRTNAEAYAAGLVERIAELEKVNAKLCDDVIDYELKVAALEAIIAEKDRQIDKYIVRAETAEAELAKAREALEPFAKLAEEVFREDMNAERADDRPVWGFDNVMMTYGDLRRARAALKPGDV